MAYSAFQIVLWLMRAGLGMRWRMPLACSGERPRRRASLTLPHRVLPSTILRTTRACADQTLGTQLGFDAAVATRLCGGERAGADRVSQPAPLWRTNPRVIAEALRHSLRAIVCKLRRGRA
jgi:hypothetical protein